MSQQVEVWTLTVDDGNGIWTTVHASESAAMQALADNYDAEGEFGDNPDIQQFCDAGMVVYVDSHIVELP